MPEPQNSPGSGHSSSSAGPRQDAWFENDLGFGPYLRTLQRRWTWLAGGALLGALVAGGFAFTRTRVYEAVTTLLVTSPLKTPGADVNPQTFRAVLENGTLALQVVTELGLAEPPERLTAQSFLERALAVESVTGTNIVRVKVRLQDPKLAAEASRRMARKAIDLTRQLNDQEGESVQSLLKEHLVAAQQRLRDAEATLLGFQKQAQVELLKEDTDAMLDERGDLLKLTVAIESEKARLAAAEREIARQEPVLSVGRAVGAEAAMRRLGAREREAGEAPRPPADTPRASREAPEPPRDPQALPRTLDPATKKTQAPRVRQESSVDRAAGEPAASDLGDVVDFTNPYVNPVYQTLDFQIANSRARLAALEQQRRQLVDVRKIGGDGIARLSELYGRQIELARLQTNYDLANKVHADLVVKFEDSRTQAIGTSPQLQLVDEALPPDRPLSRRVARFAALGAAVGLVAFAALALLREPA